MNNTLIAKNTLGTTMKSGLAVLTLAIITSGTLGLGSAQPVQAKGFVRRHPFLTAGAVGAGALMYRHHQKKQARKQARMMRSR